MKQLLFTLFSMFIILTNLNADKVIWQHNFEDAIELANFTKKPIFMFLESRQCFYCPKLLEDIFPDPKVSELINRDFVPLLLDNSVDADSDVENTGQCPPRLTVSMTPAIYFMGPNEEKLNRKGKKHMIIYGMWSKKEMIEWLVEGKRKFYKLHGDKYK